LTEHATALAEHGTAAPGSRQAHREAGERDKRARRFLLRLSLANWAVAVIAWTISAFLGITSPASIIVYSVLFVIGLIAVAMALATYLLEKFAHRPPDYEHADLEGDGSGADSAADEGAVTAAVVTVDDKPAVARDEAAAKGGAPAAPAESGSKPPANGDAPAAPAG